jgi:hypothetical protein
MKGLVKTLSYSISEIIKVIKVARISQTHYPCNHHYKTGDKTSYIIANKSQYIAKALGKKRMRVHFSK